MFNGEASQHFPSACNKDHVITLKEGAPPTLKCKVYPQTAAEEEATQTFINEHLEKGYIKESNSPYVSPFFFQKKKDGTIQDKYPLPLISTILDHLQGRNSSPNLTFAGCNVCHTHLPNLGSKIGVIMKIRQHSCQTWAFQEVANFSDQQVKWWLKNTKLRSLVCNDYTTYTCH